MSNLDVNYKGLLNERPGIIATYECEQLAGHPPLFVATVLVHSIQDPEGSNPDCPPLARCNGSPQPSKKRAEQVAAKAAIDSLSL